MDEWQPLPGLPAFVAERYRLSIGAAQQAIQKAGGSGDIRALGHYLGQQKVQLSAADWRRSTVNFEAGEFDQSGLGLRFGVFIIQQVVVNLPDLVDWLGKHYAARAPQLDKPRSQSTEGSRGPRKGTVDRFGAADRALFPKIDGLMAEGLSQSAAALKLAEAGLVPGIGGSSPVSRAKRLSAAYSQMGKLAETH